MKKRLLPLALALALCLGLAVPALAEGAGSSAEVSLWISADNYPYAGTGLTGQLRFVNDGYRLGEPQDIAGGTNPWLVPASEYFYVCAGRLAEGEEDELVLAAWSDPDGDGVYDQRLFYLDLEKNTLGVYPVPEEGAYHPTRPVNTFPQILAIPGVERLEDGTLAISAARLHGLLGDNTLIEFYSTAGGDATFLNRVLLSAGAFDDVPGRAYFSEPVAWAAEKGISVGDGTGNFMPGEDCTQLQILTFLSRAAGNTNPGEYDWTTEQKKVLDWAREKGMIGDGFDGGKPCARATAVKYIWQAFDRPSAAPGGFKDMEGYTEDDVRAVDWAKEKKITLGSGEGVFDPATPCSRATIATFLWRAYDNG